MQIKLFLADFARPPLMTHSQLLKLALLLISLGVRVVIFYVYTSQNHENQVLKNSLVLQCFSSGIITRVEAKAHPVLV